MGRGALWAIPAVVGVGEPGGCCHGRRVGIGRCWNVEGVSRPCEAPSVVLHPIPDQDFWSIEPSRANTSDDRRLEGRTNLWSLASEPAQSHRVGWLTAGSVARLRCSEERTPRGAAGSTPTGEGNGPWFMERCLLLVPKWRQTMIRCTTYLTGSRVRLGDFPATTLGGRGCGRCGWCSVASLAKVR